MENMTLHIGAKDSHLEGTVSWERRKTMASQERRPPVFGSWLRIAKLLDRRNDLTQRLCGWLRLSCVAFWLLEPISLVSATEVAPTITEEKRFSVRDFGAVGDGKADDRVAIQKAIKAANEAGGGTVYFPKGIYNVTAPEKEPWTAQVKLCRNLTMRGEDMHQSVIRIAADQGAYDLIFLGVELDHIRIVDLGFDGNGRANPVICQTDAVQSPWHHMIFHFNNCSDVSFLRCRFTELSGVWAIFASEGMTRMVIHSCHFDRIGGFTENDFDHSCVYFGGDGLSMIDNRFESRFGAGTTGARTAVEIHGSNISFSDNRINGFRYGVNVCSGEEEADLESSVHQVYRDNWLTDVGCGFAIWGLEDQALEDVEFSRNHISLDCESWKDFFPEFYGIGVVSYKDTPPPKLMKNVRLIDNVISYLNHVGGTARCCGVRFDFAAFTDRWATKPSGRLENFEMRGNRITGAYANAIDLHCDGAGIRLIENAIIDPARGDVDSAQKCAIRIRGVYGNLSIMNNSIYLNTEPQLNCGISDEAEYRGPRTIEKNRMLGRYATNMTLELRPKSSE